MCHAIACCLPVLDDRHTFVEHHVNGMSKPESGELSYALLFPRSLVDGAGGCDVAGVDLHGI